MIRYTFFLVWFLSDIQTVFGQDAFIYISPHYMYQFPMGKIGGEYTKNSNIGANLSIKLPSNLTLGAEGQYLFGGNYKDLNFLGSMVTSGGFILGENLVIENPVIESRGGNFLLEVGKIFPSNKKKNASSGWHIKAGLGYLFYSVYANVSTSVVTQLGGSYDNGYNRLESGLSFNSFFGYTFFSKNKMLNGSAGLQGIYTSTKYQGTIDFATGQPLDKSARSSFLLGPKVSISIVLKRFRKEVAEGDGYFYN